MIDEKRSNGGGAGEAYPLGSAPTGDFPSQELFEAVQTYSELVQAGTAPSLEEFVGRYPVEQRAALQAALLALPTATPEATAAEQVAWDKLHQKLFPDDQQ